MDAAARGEAGTIDLSTPLSLASSFRFPLQSRIARREILIGALWLLVPGVGWVLNMGHRIVLVHNMMRGGPAWPAWIDMGDLFKHGRVTLVGMLNTRDLRSIPRAATVCPRRRRVLACLGHRADGSGGFVSRPSGIRSRVSRYQRLVLAGRWFQLCDGLRAAIQAPERFRDWVSDGSAVHAIFWANHPPRVEVRTLGTRRRRRRDSNAQT